MTVVQKPCKCRAQILSASTINCGKSVCTKKVLKKRLPIIQWLPYYNTNKLLQDTIAGTTVALTAIPQSIAYAVVIGLPPEYGLYGGIMSGFVYLFFGGSKDITIGTTAIISAMTGKYVIGKSPDFAVLAAFLAGIVELLMGIFQLGFLVDFISGPVINGFTTAAAFQIAGGQLKSLLGLAGDSGHTFLQSMLNFSRNITTAKLWDSVLGVSTIIALFLLKWLGTGCSRTDNCTKKIKWFISLSRNAFVVIFGMIIAYVIKVTNQTEPLTLIGNIGSGLPNFGLPPFSTIVGNQTYTFVDMLTDFGPQSILLPLVAILESVAVAKAFAGGAKLDATQEMIALGLCTIMGSFVRSMPVAGSFTRTALNHASGVQTQAGGIVTSLIIILALSLLTSTFYFIPKASLAGLIITAMYSMVHFETFLNFWRHSKRELLVMQLTLIVSLTVGLEFGIMAGTLAEALILLYRTSRPRIQVKTIKTDSGELIVIPLNDRIAYCAAEHVRGYILKEVLKHCTANTIVIDGSELKGMDSTVASNLMAGVKDLETNSRNVIFMNFSHELQKLCTDLSPKSIDSFITASNLEECFIKSNVVLSKLRIE